MIDFVSNPSELSATDTLVLVGTHKAFDEHLPWVYKDVLPNLAVGGGPTRNAEESASKKRKTEAPKMMVNDLLKRVLDTLQPSPDAGASAEHWMMLSENQKDPLKVVLCVLPEKVSRHNAPSQPHSITKLLKKHYRYKKNTLVVPLVEDANYVTSVACAVARVVGVSYQRKTGGTFGIPNDAATNAPEEMGKVQMLFPSAVVSFHDLDATSTNTGTGTNRQHLKELSKGIALTRRLVDAPCNELHTDAFVQEALDSVKDIPNVTTRVIQGKDLEEKGFGGLYGVGKAAVHQPAMVILMYYPEGTKEVKSTVMVGKGIVYDTGGLSIKTKEGMPGMKRDMGGAAALLSAFVCVATSGMSTKPVHCILCLAENAVSNVATRPDDVHTLYSGKTVEINNTDAEGRLVLADGVASAIAHLNPEIIVDMATLTGAQGVATGRYFGACYCNNEELEQVAVQAGRFSGDLLHPLPFAPEFFRPEFKSAVADMKNSVADRSNAQVSCAGQFIGNHLGGFLETGKWLHIDMAYPSFDKMDERGTGYGVALMYSIIRKVQEE
jgi:probable aminopeptidase NPEPL1